MHLLLTGGGERRPLIAAGGAPDENGITLFFTTAGFALMKTVVATCTVSLRFAVLTKGVGVPVAGGGTRQTSIGAGVPVQGAWVEIQIPLPLFAASRPTLESPTILPHRVGTN